LKNPSVSEKIELEEKRRRLQKDIEKYEKKCALLTLFRGEELGMEEPIRLNDSQDNDSLLHPETIPIFLPSNIPTEDRRKHGLENMAVCEARLRVGQIHDALQRLRISLGEKSLIFREKVKASMMFLKL
jgi:hypothetical protein